MRYFIDNIGRIVGCNTSTSAIQDDCYSIDSPIKDVPLHHLKVVGNTIVEMSDKDKLYVNRQLEWLASKRKQDNAEISQSMALRDKKINKLLELFNDQLKDITS